MADTPDDRPVIQVPLFRKGNELTAEGLNVIGRAINKRQGAGNPRQINSPTSTDGQLETEARLLLTDTTVSLYGFPTVDTATPVSGDLILVVFGTTKDGMYQVADSGNWVRIGKLRSTDGLDNAPVYDPGTIISVFDGASAPALYLVANQIGFTPAS